MNVRSRPIPQLTLALFLFPALSPASAADTAIRMVLTAQVAAWNRGDIPGFVDTYAADCTFVGKQVLHGRDKLLARYQSSYPTPAAMGKLSFSNLDIRSLDKHAAVVTGEWRLERPEAAGGPVGGVFSLVFQSQAGVWRIVLDHTT